MFSSKTDTVGNCNFLNGLRWIPRIGLEMYFELLNNIDVAGSILYMYIDAGFDIHFLV